MNKKTTWLLSMLPIGLATTCAFAQMGPPGPSVVEPVEGERIVWYGTLKGARAEARRTGKPILLLAAAPHCGQTPGVW